MMRNVFAWTCLVPAVFTIAFFAYAGLSNDPGCGLQSSGVCSGTGVSMMLFAPLALSLAPLFLFLFFQRPRAKGYPS